MSLYPTLEDKNVAKLEHAQINMEHQIVAANRGLSAPASAEFMGETVPVGAMPLAPPAYQGYTGYTPYQPQAIARTNTGTVAVPMDRGLTNFKKAEIHQGVREIVIIPDVKGKLGMKVKSVSKGIFVQAVIKGLPAAAAGLRFGDQVLQVGDVVVAGFSSDKCFKLLETSVKSGRVAIAVRPRPFERTIILKKSSDNHLGFEFKNGRINAIRKDSSAARNGLLTDHMFVEVNGQNVVNMKDKDVLQIIADGGESVTLTIVPKPMFDVMVKNLGKTPKDLMDHSIPEL